MPREYDFTERLQMSQGICHSNDVTTILKENIPGALQVERACSDDDRSGTDYWVYRERGTPYGVDVKIRDQDWALKSPTTDDLALETWSVVEKEIIGWTRDQSKTTDYVLWLWKDSGRWCLIPFAMLCAVFQKSWESWLKQFRAYRQYTPRSGGGYHSECIFVPRRLVWAEIYRHYSGCVLR